MRYPEQLIAPMREDLTRFGVEEARTAAELDQALAPENGAVLLVINSVCGCAAGKARPGIGQALQRPVRPAKAVTVFAGADLEAVARAREKLAKYPPSSPSIAIFKHGEPVWMMHRHEIERRQAPEIAQVLAQAFDQHCTG